jgi:hypothetical protein
MKVVKEKENSQPEDFMSKDFDSVTKLAFKTGTKGFPSNGKIIAIIGGILIFTIVGLSFTIYKAVCLISNLF